MTITSTSIERALRRYWFRNPRFDGVCFGELEHHVQVGILTEARQIEFDIQWEQSR